MLAGREREKQVISQFVSGMAGNVATPAGLVIYGPRGNGKTVLLKWAARLARNHGIKTVKLSARSGETEEALTRKLAADSWWTRVFRAVSWRGANLSLESLRPSTVDEGLGRLVRGKPTVVLIDEAHALDRTIGENIFKSTQELNDSKSVLLLVLAGTPDLPNKLHEMQSTFWERSETLPLMRLDRDATSDAIRVPLEAAGRRITDNALERLVDETHGYPYFIQLWGRTIWYEASRTAETLGIDDVDRARPQFERARNRFYSFRFEELQKAGLVSFAAALADSYRDSEKLAAAEINRALRRVLEESGTPLTESAVDAVRTRLRDLGYIWSSGEEEAQSYVSGIPSLMSYVAKSAVD